MSGRRSSELLMVCHLVHLQNLIVWPSAPNASLTNQSMSEGNWRARRKGAHSVSRWESGGAPTFLFNATRNWNLVWRVSGSELLAL